MPENFEQQPQQPLTMLQLEAEAQTERIKEAREATERVREALKGLRYEPPTQEEQEKIAGLGGMNFRRSQELSGMDLRESQELSVKTGITQKRTQQLIDREKSISYILSSGGTRSYQGLKNARWFSIKGMAEKKERAASLFAKLDKELREPCLSNDSLQELAKEHGFRETRFFDVDEESGITSVKDLSEESTQEFRQMVSQAAKSEYEDSNILRDIIKNGRTGIDPGLLIIPTGKEQLYSQIDDTTKGSYTDGGLFRGDLGKTGVINVSMVFRAEAVRHEYKHFEDFLFNPNQRLGVNKTIDEILAWMNERPEVLKKVPTEYFGAVKEIIKKFYLPKYTTGEPTEEKKIDDTVEVLKQLYNNGFSLEAINSILMQSRKLEDILQWKNASDDDLKELVDDRAAPRK